MGLRRIVKNARVGVAKRFLGSVKRRTASHLRRGLAKRRAASNLLNTAAESRNSAKELAMIADETLFKEGRVGYAAPLSAYYDRAAYVERAKAESLSRLADSKLRKVWLERNRARKRAGFIRGTRDIRGNRKK